MSQAASRENVGPDKAQANRKFTIDDFAYDLPEELIAQEPLPVRHDSRLLHLSRSSGQIEHHHFRDIAQLLRPGDVLVLNDTRVLPARLYARRETGGLVEILLLRPEANRTHLWHAMATPLRKLKVGESLAIESREEHRIQIEDIVAGPDGQKRLLLNLGSSAGVYSLLSEIGYAPLPPYIKRDADQTERGEDLSRYQTVFAEAPGAVAAPTAGLHFSQELLARLKERQVEICKVTLHVGPGTFKPITTTVEDHTIEEEELYISPQVAEQINRALSERRRIIAVGTTSCRALESAGSTGSLRPVLGERTGLYIQPGFQFKVISGLITNFHLSRSSLLVLVSAFGGYSNIKEAYREAIEKRYRFYSYGDAMLIL